MPASVSPSTRPALSSIGVLAAIVICTHERSLLFFIRQPSPTKSRHEAPKWYLVDVKLVRKTRVLSLPEMRAAPELASMITLKRGNRLSITPVTDVEWASVLKLLG